MSLLPSKFYLDDIFNDFFIEKKNENWKCDIFEKEGKYNLEMDIPGFDKKDIIIDLTDGYLSIEARKENNIEEKDEERKYIRKERSYAQFKRQFYVGNIDKTEVKADFNNGVLKITFPKEEIKKEKNIIEIE